jgi:hypothetical protein
MKEIEKRAGSGGGDNFFVGKTENHTSNQQRRIKLIDGKYYRNNNPSGAIE